MDEKNLSYLRGHRLMASVAIAVAVSVASAAISYALTPKPVPERQADLSILKSEYGVPIPKVYGRQKVVGNVIWATDIKESSEGGKGSTTTYSYSATFAVAFCEGEIKTINKIWLNNRLVYYADSEEPNTQLASQDFLDSYCTFYYGEASQAVDPAIEAIEGVGNVPAFNNLVYIVFNDLPLKKYGNIVPTVEIEVVQEETITLQEIVEDLCLSAGLDTTELDASELSSKNVYGAIYDRDNQSPRDFIESLQKAYQFLVRDIGNKLEFIPIEQTSYIGIPSTDLSTHAYDSDLPDAYNEIREQTLDLPSVLQIEYPNAKNSYRRSVQTIYKSVAQHFNEINERTSVVLDDSQALTSVKKALEYYWLQRVRYEKIYLPSKYLALRPGDVIALEVRNQNKLLQISKINRGADLILEIEASAYTGDIGQIALVSPTNEDYEIDFPLKYAGQPKAIVIDTNLLVDEDSEKGVYGSVEIDPSSNGWNGGSLAYSPVDGQYSIAATVIEECARGYLLSELLPSSELVVDRTSRFQVHITQQLIENIPDTDFYSLKQLAYINGEVLCFQNATLVAANTYEISNLIRGVRGTEKAIAPHAIASDFYLMKGDFGFVDVVGNFTQLNQQFKFKAVPEDVAVSTIINETNLLAKGNRLKPYAPVNPKLTLKPNGDVLISWERRTRKSGEWIDGVEGVALNEESEKYDLELVTPFNPAIFSDIPQNYYLLTQAQQIAIFNNAITALDSISFRVYQKSTYIGRGYALNAIFIKISSVED
ncbi:MAG: phage tail protein [Waterburya sp.]